MPSSRVLVTGGAGFLGYHLTESLLTSGQEVTVLDTLWTGSRERMRDFGSNDKFHFIDHDVVKPFPHDLPQFDAIYHLACPASPIQFPDHPRRILHTCYMGTKNVLDLGLRCSARVLIVSSSEVYGDSQVCPQPEVYFGNVNSFGPRSCYDEGKRVAEALAYAYQKEKGSEVRIARVFNAYGPGMQPNDGRVISNFMIYALQGRPLVIYGDGRSTRCFQYVTDCIRGLRMLMESTVDVPVNIGNDHEITMEELAVAVRDLVSSRTGQKAVEITFTEKRPDDPVRRVPDIRRARQLLGWMPRVSFSDGLAQSFVWYHQWYRSHKTGSKL